MLITLLFIFSFSMKKETLHISVLSGFLLVVSLIHISSPFFDSQRDYCFRAWECAGGDPWKPLYHFDQMIHGDLSNATGVPQLQQKRRQVFSTDEYGFRNPAGHWRSEDMDFIFLGQSFGVGSQLNDDEHIVRLIENELGYRGYNFSPWPLQRVLSDSRLKENFPKLLGKKSASLGTKQQKKFR